MDQTHGVQKRLRRAIEEYPFAWAVTGILVLFGVVNSIHNRVLVPRDIHTHFSAAQIAHRAGNYCIALCGHTDGPPVLRYDDQRIGDPSSPRHRHTWTATCRANGRVFQFMFNDKTGNLSGVYSYCDLFNPPRRSMLRSLSTEQEALRMSVHWLHALDITPQGSRLQLDSILPTSDVQENWSTLWRVARPETPEVEQVLISLNRSSGLPASMANRYELAQFSED